MEENKKKGEFIIEDKNFKNKSMNDLSVFEKNEEFINDEPLNIYRSQFVMVNNIQEEYKGEKKEKNIIDINGLIEEINEQKKIEDKKRETKEELEAVLNKQIEIEEINKKSSKDINNVEKNENENKNEENEENNVINNNNNEDNDNKRR